MLRQEIVMIESLKMAFHTPPDEKLQKVLNQITSPDVISMMSEFKLDSIKRVYSYQSVQEIDHDFNEVMAAVSQHWQKQESKKEERGKQVLASLLLETYRCYYIQAFHDKPILPSSLRIESKTESKKADAVEVVSFETEVANFLKRAKTDIQNPFTAWRAAPFLSFAQFDFAAEIEKLRLMSAESKKSSAEASNNNGYLAWCKDTLWWSLSYAGSFYPKGPKTLQIEQKKVGVEAKNLAEVKHYTLEDAIERLNEYKLLVKDSSKILLEQILHFNSQIAPQRAALIKFKEECKIENPCLSIKAIREEKLNVTRLKRRFGALEKQEEELSQQRDELIRNATIILGFYLKMLDKLETQHEEQFKKIKFYKIPSEYVSQLFERSLEASELNQKIDKENNDLAIISQLSAEEEARVPGIQDRQKRINDIRGKLIQWNADYSNYADYAGVQLIFNLRDKVMGWNASPSPQNESSVPKEMDVYQLCSSALSLLLQLPQNKLKIDELKKQHEHVIQAVKNNIMALEKKKDEIREKLLIVVKNQERDFLVEAFCGRKEDYKRHQKQVDQLLEPEEVEIKSVVELQDYFAREAPNHFHQLKVILIEKQLLIYNEKLKEIKEMSTINGREREKKLGVLSDLKQDIDNFILEWGTLEIGFTDLTKEAVDSFKALKREVSNLLGACKKEIDQVQGFFHNPLSASSSQFSSGLNLSAASNSSVSTTSTSSSSLVLGNRS